MIGFCMGCMLLPGWSQRSTQGNLPNVSKGQSRRQTHNMTYMVHEIGEQGQTRPVCARACMRVCVCVCVCVCVFLIGGIVSEFSLSQSELLTLTI